METLKAAGIRVEADLRKETLQARIRDAELQKIPYMLVVGDKEVEDSPVAVRTRENEDRGAMPLIGGDIPMSSGSSARYERLSTDRPRLLPPP